MSIFLKPKKIEPKNLAPKEVKPEDAATKGLSKLRLNKWLLGLLISIPMLGIGYLAYHQFVVVPQQQAALKVQTVK
ncbi:MULTISPECIES: hypothetical protein [Leptolyngbya]|uniref:hypothetical protein n=1 Tax=Leptolyngbya TaxID=47251 RepID=UPI00168625E9|nr:hypothetical protein [Leptolyngbya sp. FACHB-1624]MBD1858657.1 hypothetical protein [Leptolyngbya sp. FACHB-1624]